MVSPASSLNRRVPVQWFSLRRVALLLDFEVKSIRGWWKQGKFGPPDGGAAADYFFTVGEGKGADVRISARGLDFFMDHHTSSPTAADVVVSGRTPGEARRELLRVLRVVGG